MLTTDMQKNKRVVGSTGMLQPSSSEKTLLELQMAVNGGEMWSVDLTDKDKKVYEMLPREVPYLQSVLEGSVPACSSCGIFVPGLLALPCACDAALCAECFEREVGCDWGGVCGECSQPAISH